MELKHWIREKCAGLDIPLVGFAPVSRWDEPHPEAPVPEQFRPQSIYPEARTVIVIGLPIALPVIETAPSIFYHELYKTVNTLLDAYAYRIALVLTEKGTPSIAIPRDGYGSLAALKENPVAFFSHRHAAYFAGLGSFGVNNTLLTRKYGPRVRFASIFTTAEIPPDPILGESLCTKCMQCVRLCPVHALGGKDYPHGLTDKTACVARSEALAKRLASPCGRCIAVCPVGEDRILFGREDMEMYSGKNPAYDRYHRAWEHVRKYGTLQSGKEPDTDR